MGTNRVQTVGDRLLSLHYNGTTFFYRSQHKSNSGPSVTATITVSSDNDS
jgi:hypothetical protein